MVEIGLIELGAGALSVIVINNFVGWFMWRSFDKHVAKHIDKINEELKRLKSNGLK